MPILISLSPNTEPDDVRLAWQTLFCPWTWRNEEKTQQIEQTLSSQFNFHPVALASSGRSALYHALKAFDISANDEVIIQAFTCLAVPAAIQWTGAKPVYVDINPNTYNIDPSQIAKAITKNTKAIIAQHTFGIPGPIEELRELAAKYNLILIEDLAHSFGATHNNQLLGTFGDAAILSFGRDKVISSVFGGAIVSKNEKTISKINNAQQKLPLPPKRWIIQQLSHPILFSMIKPLYFFGQTGKALLVILQKASLLSKAVQAREKTNGQPDHFSYRFSPALAALLQNQLSKLERFNLRRREISQAYLNGLARHAGLPPTNHHANPIWLRFPLKVNNPAKLQNQANQEKILLGDWYNSPVAPADANSNKFNYKKDSCPIAEQTAKHIINLPTCPTMTSKQVEQIIQLIISHGN